MRNFNALVVLASMFFVVGFQNSLAVAEEAATKQAEDKKAAAEKKSSDSRPSKTRLAHISIEGELPETAGQPTLFGDLGIDLRATIGRLDKAAEDEKIAGVVLEIRPAALGRGKLNELRAAIGRVRAGGKKVYAQLEMASGAQYLLASACNEVIMPEPGVVLIPGIYGEFAYYKDLFEKIGIEADMMHVGDYKGAAEPYTRRNMSEPVRKNLTAMIDDLFDQMVTTIATDRGLRVDDVRAIVDKGLLTATQALEAGLIDRVSYPDAFREHLKEQYQAEKLVYVVNYGKKKLDTDFSGPMGMIKLFQAMLGGGKSKRDSTKDHIAIVYAIGPIMPGKSQSGAFGGQSMGSTTIVEALNKAAEDKSVKAIVMRVNSPGGSALASDLIWRATQTIEKPIVVSMGDVAGSGGYYIAMGADQIIAEPGTVTGSIGVVGGKIVLGNMFGKIGITTDVISRGKNSSLFSSSAKFSETERQVVGDMMRDVYRLFTTKAAAGRDMSLEELEALAGGQVYTGRDAKRNGLIDELGTLKDAIAAAKRLAGLDPDAKTGLKILPKPRNPFESLFGADLQAEREASLISSVQHLAPEIVGPLRQAAQLRRLMTERAVLIMPFAVEIK